MQRPVAVPVSLAYALSMLLHCPTGVSPDQAVIWEDEFTVLPENVDNLSKLLPLRWEKFYFSDAGEVLLRRYFSHQCKWLYKALKALRQDTTDKLNSRPGHTLTDLINVLLNGYLDYLDGGLLFPASILKDRLLIWTPEINEIKTALGILKDDHPISQAVHSYFDRLTDTSCERVFSIRELIYAEQLMPALAAEISDKGALETQLEQTLILHNFNHFGFLSYYRRKHQMVLDQLPLNKKQAYLSNVMEQLSASPEIRATAYDERWPSVREHLLDWLQQTTAATNASLEVRPPKMRLNLSVAHLSCLLRGLYETEVIKGESLAGVFRAIAGCVSTKNQPEISVTSLKKEYYSVNQFTAARVVALLQQMILQINRNYFPVLAVISVTLAGSPESP